VCWDINGAAHLMHGIDNFFHYAVAFGGVSLGLDNPEISGFSFFLNLF
jgi:hypothetical protein